MNTYVIIGLYGTDKELKSLLEGDDYAQGNESEIQIHILNENNVD